MYKQEFLDELKTRLSGLPGEDIEESLDFYSEMIDDRMEEGFSEKDAVSDIGSVDEAVSQILDSFPLSKIVKERVKPKRHLRVWEIVLLALGSPLWLSVLAAVFAVILTGYAVVWSAVISLWSVEGSLWVCSLGGVVSAVVLACQGNMLTGAAMLGAGLFCAGLSIFIFIGCKAVTKGVLILTKKAALGMKSMFIGKENRK